MIMDDYNKTLSGLLKHSTIHGLYHISSATGKLSKLLWLFLFFLGICGLFFNLVFIVQRYLSNPILISHLVDNERFMWPDLTFCNPTAPFPLHQNPSALNHWKETIEKSKSLVKLLSTKTRLFKIIQEFNSTDNELEETTISMSTSDPQKLLSDDFRSNVLFYGYTTQHTGIYLVKEYSNSGIEVDSKDLKQFFSTQYVQIRNNIPCHTFQMDKSKILKSVDLNSAMFVIRFNYPSYQIFNSSYIFRSIFLYITSNNNLPQKDEVLILPGFNNELSIQQSRYQRNTNKRICRDEVYRVELYDALLTSTNIFEGDHEDCRKIASQKLYVDKCKCYSPFLPIYKGDEGFPKLCLNNTMFSDLQVLQNANCMVDVFEKYSNIENFNKIEKAECNKYKPIKCDEVIYKTEQRKEMWIELWSNTFNDRRRQFIQENYQPLFNRHWINRDFVKEMRDDVAMLMIKRSSQFGDFYKEEFEYPMAELISDIGGLMGLWLGLSVVGLFEILEFLYLVIMEVTLNKKEKWKRSRGKTHEFERPTEQFHSTANAKIPNYSLKLIPGSQCCEIHYCSNPYNEPLHTENGYVFSLNNSQGSRKCIQSMISSF